jgi:ElaB/YqjD/DUF883 family membrane-anchored ribosome-binding protein
MATRTSASKTNGSIKLTESAAKAASSDYDALKEDISQLRSDLQSFANNSGKYIKGRSNQEISKGVEKSKDFASKATKEAGNAKDFVETKVRENPLAAVGIAFGTGVLIAALRK